MLPRLTMSGPPLSHTDLKRLESDTSLVLPIDYAHFLLHSNGGVLQPRCSYPIYGCHDNDSGMIEILYGIMDTPAYMSVRYAHQCCIERIPYGLLPIGTGSANSILLDCAAIQPRGVFYLDEALTEPGEPWEGLYKIAGTFSEFLDVLEPLQE